MLLQGPPLRGRRRTSSVHLASPRVPRLLRGPCHELCMPDSSLSMMACRDHATCQAENLNQAISLATVSSLRGFRGSTPRPDRTARTSPLRLARAGTSGHDQAVGGAALAPAQLVLQQQQRLSQVDVTSVLALPGNVPHLEESSQQVLCSISSWPYLSNGSLKTCIVSLFTRRGLRVAPPSKWLSNLATFRLFGRLAQLSTMRTTTPLAMSLASSKRLGSRRPA